MRQISWVFILLLAGAIGSCLPTPMVDQITEQLIKDTTTISSYLHQNGIAATKLPPGIWFIIDSAAHGIRPTFNDSVKLSFSLKSLVDNSVLDHSSTPKHFVLDSMINGIQIGLPEFQAGSKGRIFIPSFYSSAISTTITPGNMFLEFKLTEVKDHQLKLDTIAIDSYLSDHSVNAVKDKSGLRYTIDNLGSGTKPLLDDEITISYTVTTMSDGVIVDRATSVTYFLGGFIMGWQIGLPNINEGSTATLYVPSSLAFGPKGYSTYIGPKENLIFAIELLKVTHH